MARKAKVGGIRAEPSIKIVDIGSAVLGKLQALTLEAQIFQRRLQQLQRTAFFRGHTGAADEITCKCDRIEHFQSRKRSLIDVLERVCASTVLTITAQARLGVGAPSGLTAPGNAPGTTTE